MSNNQGVNVNANISNIVVTCSKDAYTLSGNVSGLLAGQQVTVNNNGDINNFVIVKADGSTPCGGLIISSDGSFYGTTESGGTYNKGTVFKLTKAGAETVLYSFGATTTTDGDNPAASLIQDSGGDFYGATEFGGINNAGHSV